MAELERCASLDDREAQAEYAEKGIVLSSPTCVGTGASSSFEPKEHKEITCGCAGCKYEKDMPSHIKCQGCARMYVDKYEHDE